MELRNHVYQGDCLEVMDYIPDKCIDMVLCDLPYGTTKCKWDAVISLEPLWFQYKRIVKDNGAIVLFGMNPFSAKLVESNLAMYRYDWFWKKEKGSNFLFGNKMPLKVIENIHVFYRKQPCYNPQKKLRPNGPIRGCKNGTVASAVKEHFGGRNILGGKLNSGPKWEADKLLPTTLLEFKREHKRMHPTQKPVALLEELIKTYTNEGEIVLDNCAGSGSTGVACKRIGRDYLLIEREERYVKIIEERLLTMK